MLFFFGVCLILYALNCNYVFAETFIAIAVVAAGAFCIKQKSITHFIWTAWYIFLNVLQYAECYVHAENYAKKNTYMNYFLNLSLLRDDTLRRLFFLYATIFYIIILAVVCAVERIDRIEGSKISACKQNEPKWEIYFNPFVWLGIALILQYLYLYLTRIGKIPAVGVVHYGLEAAVLFLTVMLLKQLLAKEQLFSKIIIQTIFIALLKSLPALLNGSKSATIFAVLIFGMAIYMYDSERFRKVINFKILLWAVAAAFFAFAVSYRMKFNHWPTSPDYIIRRFTGYNDGIAFLNYYLRLGNQYFPGGLIQWADNVIGIGDGINVNSFYTHNILGYARTGVMSAGLPPFCGGLLYGNSVGLILTAGVTSLVMSLLERKMREGTQIEYIVMQAFIYVRTIHMLIDGAMDNIKQVITAAAGCLILLFVTKALHIRFVLQEIQTAKISKA